MTRIWAVLALSLFMTPAMCAEHAGVKGGLAVRLGCSEPAALIALRASESFLVHGLGTDAEIVARAREHIRSRGLYGSVSADRFDGKRLPYTDNLVNLFVADELGMVTMDEVNRVLVPNGVAVIGGKRTIKPRPDAIDHWTHYLGNPDGNAVAKDMEVGMPRHMQWVAGPRWARGHENQASVSAVVASNGRIFSIIDEGPTESVTLPAKWSLIARDAFNGVLLWKKPIPLWESQMRGFRSGPANLPRRLVAVGDHVYVTLGYTEPVCQIDGATGKVLQTYAGTEGATEIVLADGTLYVVKGQADRRTVELAVWSGRPSPHVGKKAITVLRAADGRALWNLSGAKTDELLTLSLAVSGNRLVFHNPNEFICMDAKTGAEVWTTPHPMKPNGKGKRPGWSSPTVVIHKDVVITADLEGGKNPGQMVAYAMSDGRKLWSTPSVLTWCAPPDVFVINGEVWSGQLRLQTDSGFSQLRDVKTGEVTRTLPTDPNRRVGMYHHRCYRNRATSRYVLAGRAGIEFLNVKDGSTVPHNWVRGTCQLGIIPANGLIYAPPHSCICYPKALLNGFNALAALRPKSPKTLDGLLEKGPAYGQEAGGALAPTDWPAFRHDNARSGVASCTLPATLKPAWQCKLPGKLSAPVAAGGKLYVAGVDTHTVYALDASSGSRLWTATVGGRIDSPPTIDGNRVYVGSRDGYVYCFSTRDGDLVWRFRAGPEDRRCVAYGQLESVYPVHGSVLVHDGKIMFASGRSSYMDGGIRIYCLDARTGQQLSVSCINDWDPKTGLHPRGFRFDMPGSLPDILSTDGTDFFMRQRVLDAQGKPQAGMKPHLFSPTGFLDATWWHRTYWVYGRKFGAGWSYWNSSGGLSGRILTVGKEAIYGYGRSKYPGGNKGQWRTGEYYRFFAVSKTRVKNENGRGSRLDYRWQKRMPIQGRAMVPAGSTLLVAGPPDKAEGDESKPIGPLALGSTGKLLALNIKDGTKAAEYHLSAAPVFDGMIAASGRLYVVGVDGSIQAFQE
jgi:outer membrane protein assembly factor BamB